MSESTWEQFDNPVELSCSTLDKQVSTYRGTSIEKCMPSGYQHYNIVPARYVYVAMGFLEASVKLRVIYIARSASLI